MFNTVEVLVWLGYLLAALGGLLVKAQPPIPCPRLFRYESRAGSWQGRLTLPVSPGLLPLKVSLQFSLLTVLSSKYVGLIELSEPPDKVLERILEEKSKTINYTVRFPVPFSLPMLEKIILNNRTICSGPTAIHQIITKIKLEHEFPANVFLLDPEYFKNKVNSGKRCGLSTMKRSDREEPVTGHGEWPWLAAILLEVGYDLQFHCAGTLISMRHIISAAHCVINQPENGIESNKLLVYLGKHDLREWGDPDSQLRQVSEIIVHPEYSPKYYEADLAILVLSVIADYDNFVKPVCLWDSDEPRNELVGRMGTVVGWSNEDAREPIRPVPRMYRIPIVDMEDCLRSQPDFLYVTSQRTFCAGFRNGSGPCNGDSGSGMVLPREHTSGTTTWRLRGLISLSLLDRNNFTCDLHQYIVFTDLYHYLPWISRIIKN